MKCKECNSLCSYRTTNGEAECYYEFQQREALAHKDDADWQIFRRETARDVLCSLITAPGPDLDIAVAVPKAVKIADLLIKQLRSE